MIKLYTYYNDDFCRLKKRFEDSLKDNNIEVIYKKWEGDSRKQMCGGFDLWEFKTNDIISCIEANWEEVFIYSDIDIEFFQPIGPCISEAIKDYDIVFQKNPLPAEGLVNIGFMAIRANVSTLRFWKKVLKLLQKTKKHDQRIVQDLLGASFFPVRISQRILKIFKLLKPSISGTTPVKFSTFPLEIWAHSKNEEWNAKRPQNLLLCHATWAVSEDDKIEVLENTKAALRL